MDVHVIDHPLAQSRLTAMRDARTDSSTFRAALHELTTMLVYEAARSFPVEQYPVQTPVTGTEGTRLANPPLLVPVLRAGLGMADAALGLLPESSMGFVGLARDEETLRAARLHGVAARGTWPACRCWCSTRCSPPAARWSTAAGCSPTGAAPTSPCSACSPRPVGIERLERSGLPLRLVTASIDEGLNDHMFIVPGLGDAGDRQFGGMPRF